MTKADKEIEAGLKTTTNFKTADMISLTNDIRNCRDNLQVDLVFFQAIH